MDVMYLCLDLDGALKAHPVWILHWIMLNRVL